MALCRNVPLTSSPGFSVIMSIAALYNTLPSLHEADEQFTNRDQVLATLGPLFAKYGDKFGLCLVHRHCTLKDGEMMVATGKVSQPETDVKCYPERWLATGQPFEFNVEPTGSPPSELVEEFQNTVQGMSVRGVDVLGLFFVRDKEHVDGTHVERTEGRKNIMEVAPVEASHMTTCWIPRDGYCKPEYRCDGLTHCGKPYSLFPYAHCDMRET